MNGAEPRNRLMPLYLGFVLIFAAASFVAYRMIMEDCGTTPYIEIGVLVVIPIVYLGLIYLILVSQK